MKTIAPALPTSVDYASAEAALAAAHNEVEPIT